MPLTVDYREDLLERLRKSPDSGQGYLDACLEEGIKTFLAGLRNVVDARGGVSKLSRETGLSRPALHAALSDRGNPNVHNLVRILEALGLRLSVAVSPPHPNRQHTA